MPRVSKRDQEAQKDWEDRIARAKKVRENWKKLFKVDMGRDYFDGKQNPGWPDEEWITVNKIYSHLKAQLPNLYNSDPYFYMKLRRSFSTNPLTIALWEKRGKIRQSYLNYLKEELRLKEKARLCIQDAHFSYGIAKTYYHADEIKNDVAGQPIFGEDDIPLFDHGGAPLVQPEYIPINERYCISRIHPDDFLWDEDAGPLEESWKWVAELIREPLEEVKKNRLFSRAALKALETKTAGDGGEAERNRDERKKGGDVKGKSEIQGQKPEDKEEQKIIYRWHIYDLKEKTWSVIVEGGEIPLVNAEPLPPGTEKYPYSILRFTLRDDSPYPIPPISQGIDPQKEFNMARSRIMTHRKRFNRKYEAYTPGLADESELSKLESGEDGTIIKKVQATQVVTPIQDAPLDQQNYLEINFLNKDLIELLGGASDEARGIAGAESATQAGILDKRLEMKEGDAMSMVVDFVRDIARKIDQLVQVHINKDEAVKICGGPEGEFWELVKVEDYDEINGEYSYEVNVGATIPRLPQMERASLTAILTLFSQFPHLLTIPELVKQVLEMHHIENDMLAVKLVELGQKIMSGRMPMPGAMGSQAGVGEERPVSAVGGQAGGPNSLAMPLGGNGGQ